MICKMISQCERSQKLGKQTMHTVGSCEATLSLIERLRIRAAIRRQIPTRKSVLEGKPDRIADLLEEAASELERLLKE